MSYTDDYDDVDDDEPRCAECGAFLYTELHVWDCSYGDEDEEDDDQE